SPARLAGQAHGTTGAATKAKTREAEAPGVDGHSLRAEDAANSSGHGGFH
ncbi:hypothetical protein N309_13096, partial [Tinamus guttatus]